MLKYSYNNADDIPEGFSENYTEQDGIFTLNVEGAVSKKRLDEFRDSNIALKKELESTSSQYSQFDGIDPELARKLIDQNQKQKDKKLLEAGEVDKLVENRTTSIRDNFQSQIDSLTQERDNLNQRLAKREIDSAVMEHAAKHGVQKSATEDVLNRARHIFTMQEGKAVAVEDGQPVYDEKGDPLTVASWVEKLVQGAPHLFNQNTGGGATGTPAGGNGNIPNGDNPFDRSSGWNLTEQMQIMKTDPVKANRLKMAAGFA